MRTYLLVGLVLMVWAVPARGDTVLIDSPGTPMAGCPSAFGVAVGESSGTVTLPCLVKAGSLGLTDPGGAISDILTFAVSATDASKSVVTMSSDGAEVPTGSGTGEVAPPADGTLNPFFKCAAESPCVGEPAPKNGIETIIVTAKNSVLRTSGSYAITSDAPVPEPSTVYLFVAGLVALASRAKNVRQAR